MAKDIGSALKACLSCITVTAKVIKDVSEVVGEVKGEVDKIIPAPPAIEGPGRQEMIDNPVIDNDKVGKAEDVVDKVGDFIDKIPGADNIGDEFSGGVNNMIKDSVSIVNSLASMAQSIGIRRGSVSENGDRTIITHKKTMSLQIDAESLSTHPNKPSPTMLHKQEDFTITYDHSPSHNRNISKSAPVSPLAASHLRLDSLEIPKYNNPTTHYSPFPGHNENINESAPVSPLAAAFPHLRLNLGGEDQSNPHTPNNSHLSPSHLRHQSNLTPLNHLSPMSKFKFPTEALDRGGSESSTPRFNFSPKPLLGNNEQSSHFFPSSDSEMPIIGATPVNNQHSIANDIG